MKMKVIKIKGLGFAYTVPLQCPVLRIYRVIYVVVHVTEHLASKDAYAVCGSELYNDAPI